MLALHGFLRPVLSGDLIRYFTFTRNRTLSLCNPIFMSSPNKSLRSPSPPPCRKDAYAPVKTKSPKVVNDDLPQLRRGSRSRRPTFKSNTEDNVFYCSSPSPPLPQEKKQKRSSPKRKRSTEDGHASKRKGKQKEAYKRTPSAPLRDAEPVLFKSDGHASKHKGKQKEAYKRTPSAPVREVGIPTPSSSHSNLREVDYEKWLWTQVEDLSQLKWEASYLP